VTLGFLHSKLLLIFISFWSSRCHLTVGRGEPVAWQLSVTFEFSRTIASELLMESSIFGGTKKNRRVHGDVINQLNSTTPAASRSRFWVCEAGRGRDIRDMYGDGEAGSYGESQIQFPELNATVVVLWFGGRRIWVNYLFACGVIGVSFLGAWTFFGRGERERVVLFPFQRPRLSSFQSKTMEGES